MIVHPPPSGIVTFTSDFGTRDHYVAEMKGAALFKSPSLTLVDVSHEIPPQDVQASSFVARNASFSFPPGTVHVVVVDPGVGSERAALACLCCEQYFIGPDNGFLNLILDRGEYACVSLDLDRLGFKELSNTFHGRDVFAPAAALLASGQVPFSGLGEPLEPVRRRLPEPKVSEQRIDGCIIHVDHFGNLMTNISTALLAGRTVAEVSVGEVEVKEVVQYYAQGTDGALVALVGSNLQLDVCLVNGSAAAHLGVGVSDEVVCLLEEKG